MFRTSPAVKQLPAMPIQDGKRISLLLMPSATLDQSSPVSGSNMNKVLRSASSISVVTLTILPSRFSRVSSEEIALVISSRRASSRWARSTFWIICAFSMAMLAWAVRVSSRERSLSSKSPLCLFRAWVTPMICCFLFRTGIHRMLRVL